MNNVRMELMYFIKNLLALDLRYLLYNKVTIYHGVFEF